MFIPGLVSVTFRQLTPEQIVELVRVSGLEAIEWGGDIHVPHGDLTAAESVRDLTRAAGLTIAAYGSYYRVGHNEPVDFEQILANAVALDTSIIRVWAGKQGSDKADETYWQKVIEDSRRICDLAADAKKVVAYEYHANTLTDTCDGTLRLIHAVNSPNLRTYWQPVSGRSLAQNLEELIQLLPYLCHVHAFYWVDGQRRPLAEGLEDWQAYLSAAWQTRRDHGVLLEFVTQDEPASYLADARSLQTLLQKFQPS